MIGKVALAVSLVAAAASAGLAKDKSEIGYPLGSLGTKAIVAANYETAEHQLLNSDVDVNDPARLLNLGHIYAATGRPDQARSAFSRVLRQDDLDLILANGSHMSSHEAARNSLKSLGQ